MRSGHEFVYYGQNEHSNVSLSRFSPSQNDVCENVSLKSYLSISKKKLQRYFSKWRYVESQKSTSLKYIIIRLLYNKYKPIKNIIDIFSNFQGFQIVFFFSTGRYFFLVISVSVYFLQLLLSGKEHFEAILSCLFYRNKPFMYSRFIQDLFVTKSQSGKNSECLHVISGKVNISSPLLNVGIFWSAFGSCHLYFSY